MGKHMLKLCTGVVITLLWLVQASAVNLKLSNGITLQTVHPAGSQDVAIRLLVPVGGRNDPRGQEGLAHYVEHLLASDPGPLGSGSNLAPQLSAHGYANAHTLSTATWYVMNVPPESLESALSLLAERLSHLETSDAVAAREQRVVRQEYSVRYGNNPAIRLMAELRTGLGQTDPALGWTIGTPDSIKTFDLLNARTFFDRWYRPETMTLVLSGRFDVENARELAERTIGLIQFPPAPPEHAGSVPPVPAPQAVDRDDPDAAVPTMLRHDFVQAAQGNMADVIREHAAMVALQRLLMGTNRGAKGILAALKESHDDVLTVAAGLTRLDRRWLMLGVSVEADLTAGLPAMANLVSGRLASLHERDVPDEFLAELQNFADRSWLVAEDAPAADSVVDWLSMGFSLEERPALRAALMNLKKQDIVAFAHKLSVPATSATVFLRPRE
jgi:zinc protease